MGKYRVEEIAAELMLDPEDLGEVFEAFFDETQEMLLKCEKALKNNDYQTLKKIFHSLKGSSANLRMKTLNELAVALEDGSNSFDQGLIEGSLPDLQKELTFLQEQVKNFYYSS